MLGPPSSLSDGEVSQPLSSHPWASPSLDQSCLPEVSWGLPLAHGTDCRLQGTASRRDPWGPTPPLLPASLLAGFPLPVPNLPLLPSAWTGTHLVTEALCLSVQDVRNGFFPKEVLPLGCFICTPKSPWRLVMNLLQAQLVREESKTVKAKKECFPFES